MEVLIIIAITVVTVVLYYKYKNRKFWDKVNKIKGLPTLPLIGNAHQLRSDLHGTKYVEMDVSNRRPNETGQFSSLFIFNNIKRKFALKSLENNIAVYLVGAVKILRLFLDNLNMWQKFGRGTYKMQLGSDVFVILSTPECVEVILKHNTQLSKPVDYRFLYPWLGEGLLTSGGAKWKRQRRIITPTFHFKILEQFSFVFNKYSKILLELLEPQKGKIIDIYPIATRYALDVICDTAMGKSVNAQKDETSLYVKAVNDLSTIIYNRIFSGFKRNQFIFNLSADGKLQKKTLKFVHELSNRLIKSRREEMKDEINAVFSIKENSFDLSQHIETGEKLYRPFLDLLLLSKLPDGQPLDDVTIRDEVDTVIFGGHDTTASAVSFTIYSLSKHPEVQTKAFEEQRMLFGSDIERDPTHSELQEMKYLEIVIKETLRMYPTAPCFGRKMNEDLSLPDGTEVPAGCTVIIYVYAMHRNSKYFPDPEKFYPERFLNEPMKEHGPFIYVPFSAGPRNCLGQKFAMLELKSVISKILRRFEVTSPGPGYEIKLGNQITLKSTNGINVILGDRKY